MLKKSILSTVLSVILLAGASSASATVVSEPEQSVEAVEVQVNINTPQTVNTDEQAAAPVQESNLAKKMTQAEKAKNAAENDGYGFAITIIAMVIVLFALIVLSLLFLGFGKVSSWLQRSRKHAAHGVTRETSEEHHDELDSGETIAAIGMALAEHFGQGHDIEDTILTIRRMRKSYSPWNSKIYNLRHNPHIAGHNMRKI